MLSIQAVYRQHGAVPFGATGASYTIGPIVFGAHGLYYKSAGDLGNAFAGRLRIERGIAAGSTYSLAPGVSLFLSYLWNERRQNGYNFLTGQGVSPTAPGGNAGSNLIHAQLIYSGLSFSW